MTKVPEKNLPGADLVVSGIEALQRGEMTVEALLVAVGAKRLRAAGLQVSQAALPDQPELALYTALVPCIPETPGTTASFAASSASSVHLKSQAVGARGESV